MDLHSLKNVAGARKRRKRVGRGMASGHGKTAGKGAQGQMARSGHKHKLGFEGGQIPLIRRVPKHGFTNPVRGRILTFNVGDLDRFGDGVVVTEELLRSAGLVKGRADGIKLLGRGEVGRKVTVKAQAFSIQAKAKVEAAGGTCEVVQA